MATKVEETEEGQTTEPNENTDNIELDDVFGDTPNEEPSDTIASGDEEHKEEVTVEKTEEELAAAKVEEDKAAEEAKVTYDSLSDEEKVAEDKKVADAAEATQKAEFEKLSPEEQKVVTDKFAADEKEAATKEKTDAQARYDEQTIALSKSEKRRADTERWAQERHQEALQIQRENIILQKQAKDPDYDPATDESLKEVGPTEEEKAHASEQRGRAGASMRAAFDKYGEDNVRAELAEYKVVFGEDRAVQQQVRDAEQPVEEALSVLRLNKFFVEFGSDPKVIMSNVETKLRKELTVMIRNEESKRIMADLKKTSKIPKGLSGVKTIGSGDDKEKGTAPAKDSMEELFDNQ